MRPIVAEAVGLEKHFLLSRGNSIRAVDGLSFQIFKGETLALVGESGCGKTTTAELMLLLQKSTGGDILFHGEPIAHLAGKRLPDLRRRMQVVFQNPRSSLNPRMRIREIIGEALLVRDSMPKEGLRSAVDSLLQMVKLEPRLATRFPHEISGGQAQRVAIARALATDPELILLDEPTSALDVSVQAQIINLLKQLQRQRELTYLFISHDLRIVRHLSDRVGIMYLGKIVELGPTAQIFNNPRHPYTRALMSAIPRTHPRMRSERIILKGDVPSAAAVPSGCRFHTRCYAAQSLCSEREPVLSQVDQNSSVACHFPN